MKLRWDAKTICVRLSQVEWRNLFRSRVLHESFPTPSNPSHTLRVELSDRSGVIWTDQEICFLIPNQGLSADTIQKQAVWTHSMSGEMVASLEVDVFASAKEGV